MINKFENCTGRTAIKKPETLYYKLFQILWFYRVVVFVSVNCYLLFFSEYLNPFKHNKKCRSIGYNGWPSKFQ